MRTMPLKLRRECDADPRYGRCMRQVALGDHLCNGNPMTGQFIEWDHTHIFAGRQTNEKWAIVAVCWYVHSGPGFNKEINVWIGLNQATEEELQRHSKAENLIAKRERLNKKYGTVVDVPLIPRI